MLQETGMILIETPSSSTNKEKHKLNEHYQK